MKNEILEELWKSKDEVAREYKYSTRRLAEGLRRKEKGEKAEVIDLSTERKTSSAKKS